ncbi:MAG: M20/M25/M40 family metallo-hydrolase [Candidatus Aminicenantes bacterium]|nr:M20/M25/M40 family metallo-hydrolase [Candidatus Aminicenantes bacterium]
MKRAALPLLALAFGLSLRSAPPVKIPIDGRKALEHVRVLAVDGMKGRASGSPEYRLAAEYVAARMKEYGLIPAAAGGSYFQDVPFKNQTSFDPPPRLAIVSPAAKAFTAGRDRDFFPAYGTGSGTARGPVAFAGYGVVSDSPAWDDYAGLDAKGRILVILPDAPASFGTAVVQSWTLERKVKLAAERGAAGIIEMNLNERGRPSIRRLASGMIPPGAAPAGFVVVHADRDVLDDLFYAAKSSWRDAVSRILRLKSPHSFALDASVEMEAHFAREDRTALNVLGLLPGRDAKRKAEAVIIGGHLDHLGSDMNGLVYPGADDNAASVAVVLEIARAIQASGYRPARTLLFAAWAGEENGTVGSRFYVEHPVIPLAETVCYLNMDMVGTGDSDLFIGGLFEYARFYDLIRPKLDPDISAKLKPRVDYRGSDHSTFWDKGVASISLRTGGLLTNALDDEHPEYHRPGDRVDYIDPELLGLAGRYHAEVIQALADNTTDNLFDPRFRAEFLHKDAAVVDLHCDTISRFMAGEDLRLDLPKGHIDIPKLKRGAVDLQVFACYAPPPATDIEKATSAKGVFDQIEAVYRLAAQNPGDLAVIRTLADFSAVRNTGQTAALIGIEGGYAIQNDLDLLRAFYRMGVRLMTLTHWTHTDWADASGDPAPTYGGLTEFGESVVREMNRLGMIIDVSHSHDETFWDVLRLSKAPVVASHSCCRALADHHRNLTDDMLKALAKAGGMVGINFSTGFLDAATDKKRIALRESTARENGLPTDYREAIRTDPDKKNPAWALADKRIAELDKTLPKVDVRTLVDHIDHVVKVTGNADAVGLGSDYDGISAAPAGLEDAGKLIAVTEELLRRGYKESDVRKILGGNFLRIFGAVERAAEK